MIPQQIAEAFSNGNFEVTYPHFADDVEWLVIGEHHIQGKESVMDQCNQTAKYFQSVTTHFVTLNVITTPNRIAINGTAEFIRNQKRVAFVHACDVYEFNDEHKLQKVTSYCIPEQTK
ncbi:MAG: nuclear transport factor 2 family protein [Bacteroidota bacterium]